MTSGNQRLEVTKLLCGLRFGDGYHEQTISGLNDICLTNWNSAI